MSGGPPDRPRGKRPKPAFPKKSQPPSPRAFAAQLPLPLGRRIESVRGFLTSRPGVTEDVHYYGPKSGWALRYLLGRRPLCALLVHGGRPLGIVSLDAAASAEVDWRALSPLARRARRAAHGSPQLAWLDVPLDGAGAADFRAILKAKLTKLSP